MKKTVYKLLMLTVVLITFSTTFISCKMEDLLDPSRLFRPMLADDDVETGLDSDTVPYIKVNWDKYADANQYVVKVVATDRTDSAEITTDGVTCTFNNLKFDKEYNIKIRSVNTDNGLESKDFVTSVVTPDFPTQLVNITSTNIIDTQVRIKWNTSDNGSPTVLDTIKIFDSETDTLVSANAVLTNDLALGEKIIRKLQPSTKYRVEAYQGGKYKGKKLFTTSASESYTGLIIDLRGLTSDESYKYFSTGSESLFVNKVDSIVKANPDQSITFVLQGGVTYRMPTLMIPATTGKIKFTTGLSLNGLASFAVSGNFDAVANATIGGFEFKKLFFTDAPIEGKSKTADTNYGGTYLFNFSGANSKVGSIKISDCTIKYKRGILRIKEATAVDTVAINNCIVDSIAGYGIVNVDFATAKINNVNVTNSTFSSCQVLFVGTKQAAIPINEISVQNSTFVYCVANGGYIFNYSGCTISNFVLKNCVFGIGGKNPAEVLTTGNRGWSGSATPSPDACYFTSDYFWQLNTSGVPVAQINGTTLTTNTAQTFENPSKGNFKVISTELKKVKAGDPRWY